MSVEFEEDMAVRKYQSHVIIGQPKTPSVSNFFVKTGIVKNQAQAYKFLVFLFFAFVIAALLVYYFFVIHAGHAPTPTPA